MTNTVRLGRLFALDMLLQPQSFVIGSAVLFATLLAIGAGVFGWPLDRALVTALLCVGLHWLLDIAHNIGHAIAARRTGYPMSGVLLGEKLFFGRSLYPASEPTLPARVHITRALGGPILSSAIALVAGIALWLVWRDDSLFKWLCAWCFVESVSIFGPGALMPLGFTDGGTLRTWLPLLNAKA
jgi:hypothetical protein